MVVSLQVQGKKSKEKLKYVSAYIIALFFPVCFDFNKMYRGFMDILYFTLSNLGISVFLASV
jgi:hypothetical protein